jgi:hypothetical protein
MSKLKELEKRLRDEPDNLGLRVAVAGALHEAGRRDDAIELYRSVALVYREQGRTQQAITVCRRILELAPDDVPCRDLMDILVASQSAALEAPPIRPSPSRLPWPRFSRTGSEAGDEEDEERDGPASRPSGDATPLPAAVPYHVADPTSLGTLPRSALPPSLREEFDRYPQIAGIADTARQISEALIAVSPDDDEADIAAEDEDNLFDLDTRRIPQDRAAGPAGRFAPPAMVEFGDGDGDGDGEDDPRFLSGDGTPHVPIDDDDERSALSPVNGVPHVRIDGDERPTRSPARGVPRARIIDDEKTARRERPSYVRPPDKE